MIKINIKPLSVNQAWQGKRFKTVSYKDYEKEMLLRLPKLKVAIDKNLSIVIKVGYSNKNSDIDNCVKPFLDILQKKYGFNDSHIYKLTVEKEIVKKKEEYIEFDIKVYI